MSKLKNVKLELGKEDGEGWTRRRRRIQTTTKESARAQTGRSGRNEEKRKRKGSGVEQNDPLKGMHATCRKYEKSTLAA